jgi:hypothetical protein
MQRCAQPHYRQVHNLTVRMHPRTYRGVTGMAGDANPDTRHMGRYTMMVHPIWVMLNPQPLPPVPPDSLSQRGIIVIGG